MVLRILVIGGTGEISASCVREMVDAGHEVSVFNRGQRNRAIDSIRHVRGDITDEDAFAALGGRDYDVVCQFLTFQPDQAERDVDVFSERCGQFIFVSSASCYTKPWTGERVTEDVPLDNPYLAYSRDKALCERVFERAHADGRLASTIVRPSHTYRERVPSTIIDGDHLLWRLLEGKPVPVHGDGESLWTLTRSEDFARAFVRLCGNPRALGQDFHITDSVAYRWNEIYARIADALGIRAHVRAIEIATLLRHNDAWRGTLLGDKANSMIFDNAKIASVTDGWTCRISIDEGLALALDAGRRRLGRGYRPDADLDALIDTIVAGSVS